MDLQEYINQLLSNVVANIPGIVLILVAVVSSLAKVKTTISAFSTQSKESEKNIVENTEKKIQELSIRTQKALDETIKRTNDMLEKAYQELESYKNQLVNLKLANQHVVKVNKLFIDNLITLLSKDKNLIYKGISQQIVNEINMTKEELAKYPDVLKENFDILKQALAEFYNLNGKEELDNLMEEVIKNETKEL